MTQNNQFPEILKYLRKEEGWPQALIAQKIDVSSGSYSSYERGLSEPPLSVLMRLAAAFNVSIDFLASGKEYILPLSEELTHNRHLDRMTLRIENRVERQTRLLSHIGRKLEGDISSLVKKYSTDFDDAFSRSSGMVLLEEELWNIELCSRKTMVAYPYVDDNLVYDPDTGHYHEGDYFHYQVANLCENPDHEYVEIYASNVELSGIEDYKKLVKQHCGKAALKRVEIWQCDHSIISQYVIYDVKVATLREKHPSVFQVVANSIIDDRYIALIVTPQHSPDVNILADKEHCEYIRNHFKYLLTKSKRV